jgi:hypothetical protein
MPRIEPTRLFNGEDSIVKKVKVGYGRTEHSYSRSRKPESRSRTRVSACYTNLEKDLENFEEEEDVKASPREKGVVGGKKLVEKKGGEALKKKDERCVVVECPGRSVSSTLRGNARLQTETRFVDANHTSRHFRDFNCYF